MPKDEVSNENAAKHLAGLMRLFNEQAPIAKTFGMTLSFDEERRAVVDLPHNPGLDHALKGIHGGVYMTMLDTAAWFSSAALHQEECWITTSEMAVHFLRASANTHLRAVGTLMKRGKRQDVVEAHLYDGDSKLVGHGVGSFIVLPGIPLKD
jgi:uncharacterized protein (TIGR00369 family)